MVKAASHPPGAEHMHAEIDYTRHYLRWHNDSDDYFMARAAVLANKLEPLLPPDRSAPR